MPVIGPADSRRPSALHAVAATQRPLAAVSAATTTIAPPEPSGVGDDAADQRADDEAGVTPEAVDADGRARSTGWTASETAAIRVG